MNRYYQPGSLRQRTESDDNVDGRRRRQKEHPPIKQIRPVVVSVEVPGARKQAIKVDSPKLIRHQRSQAPTALARAVGMSLGSTELTIYIKPHRHLRLHAREIPHTFNYIETESHIVQGREQPVAYRDHVSSVTPSKRSSMPVAPQRVTAIVPSKFSPLPIAKKEKTGQGQSIAIRKRATTLPSRLPRHTMERGSKLRKISPQPLPTHQTIYQIPPPPSNVGPAILPSVGTNDTQSGTSEEEGEASSTVIISPPRPPPPEEDVTQHLSDPQCLPRSPPQFPESSGAGEVCVVVGDRSGTKPTPHHPTRITIHGEKQADPKGEFVLVTPEEVDEEPESRSEEPADYSSESDEEPPSVPERPRGDYSVRINIDSEVPEMVHEPVPPPVLVRAVHAEWDSFELSPPPEVMQSVETEQPVEKVQFVQSAVDWKFTSVGEDARSPTPMKSPEPTIQPEPAEHDPVHSPIQLIQSSPAWPDIESPEPSGQLVFPVSEPPVVRMMADEEDSAVSWGQAPEDVETVNEVDFALRKMTFQNDPTFPMDPGTSPPPEMPGIFKWFLLVS